MAVYSFFIAAHTIAVIKMNTRKNRILQITDTHLFADPQGHLMGVKTLSSLDAVLERIQDEYSDFNGFLVTGDLSQDKTRQSYQLLKDRLDVFGKPQFWLQGNHDNTETMQGINSEAMIQRVAMGRWQILLLNSQVPGQPHGHLKESELKRLEEYLWSHSNSHSLIALHHHPESINSLWMDKIGLDNAGALQEVLMSHSNVKGIVHGHVHQAREYSLDDVPVLATPSTCLQFLPESTEFSVEPAMPGFRVLDLLETGEIESLVVRLDDFALGLDLSLNGY